MRGLIFGKRAVDKASASVLQVRQASGRMPVLAYLEAAVVVHIENTEDLLGGAVVAHLGVAREG